MYRCPWRVPLSGISLFCASTGPSLLPPFTLCLSGERAAFIKRTPSFRKPKRKSRNLPGGQGTRLKAQRAPEAASACGANSSDRREVHWDLSNVSTSFPLRSLERGPGSQKLRAFQQGCWSEDIKEVEVGGYQGTQGLRPKITEKNESGSDFLQNFPSWSISWFLIKKIF